MQDIIYRKPGKDEINLIIDIRLAFLYELQGNQPSEKESSLRRSLADYFRKSLQDNSFICWIAEVDSKPVGMGGMVIQEIPGHYDLINGNVGYILNMYTLPGHRKKGICSNIMTRLIDDGRKLGLNKIYLHASKDGIELYRKKGFGDPDLPELELLLSN
jgi:GNAT superfamily N-acetyltransferase